MKQLKRLRLQKYYIVFIPSPPSDKILSFADRKILTNFVPINRYVVSTARKSNWLL